MSAAKLAPTILIVEDEPILRIYAASVLEDAGFKVIEAGNAEHALSLFSTNPDIAVLFTDINMPGDMDGLALAAEVHRRHPDVHLIVTSGKIMPAKDDLPDDSKFLPKPYAAERITRTVAQMLS
ncbi:MAG TPA: response regulator [Rhizomicrobium sp.]|nr:response regulator [Rhizomicrobium sp.]